MPIEINTKNEIAKIKDYSFFNRTMFLFENNKYVNSIFVNEITDKEYSDFSSCNNIVFDIVNACVTIGNLYSYGTYVSSTIKSFTDEESKANNFFLIVDDVTPIGTDIVYQIVSDSGDTINITPNRNIPLVLPNGSATKSFKLKAELKSNGINKPKINSLAIMYFDDLVDTKLNLHEPDIKGNGSSSTNPTNTPHKHDNYVEKIPGKGLSSNDYTDIEKIKLNSLKNYEHPDTHDASMIIFSDNKTFQQKLNDGSLRGEKGDTGLKGEQGERGPAGNDGQATSWLSGTEDPLKELGKYGDWYINTTSLDIFYNDKLSNNWIKKVNMVGDLQDQINVVEENLNAISDYLNYMPINGGSFEEIDGNENTNIIIDGGTY